MALLQAGVRSRRIRPLADCRSAIRAGLQFAPALTSALAADRHDDEELRRALLRAVPSRCSRCWSPAARRRRRASAGARAGARSAPAPAPAAPAAPPPRAAPFADAVARAGERLLRTRRRSLGSGPRELVIDPLIDASTGQQTDGHGADGAAARRADHAPRAAWNVQPLTRAALASRPLLLIGTLTAINTKDVQDENADAFRVCLALVDLRTGKVVAKRVDRATLATVGRADAVLPRQPDLGARSRPRRLHQVVPGQLARRARSRRATCSGCRRGDDRRGEARLRREQARRGLSPLSRGAQPVADPDDLRVLNGLYTTGWKTGRKKEATETFGQIVGIGLDTQEAADQDVLQSRHRRPARTRPTCRRSTRSGCARSRPGRRARELPAVVGHTSRTGDAAANDVLSQKRAASSRRPWSGRTRSSTRASRADGVGSREVIVGLGTDDLRDALDRRVEFRTVDCR